VERELRKRDRLKEFSWSSRYPIEGKQLMSRHLRCPGCNWKINPEESKKLSFAARVADVCLDCFKDQ
jgi:hypothetical protein